jgi:hypothetical protein
VTRVTRPDGSVVDVEMNEAIAPPAAPTLRPFADRQRERAERVQLTIEVLERKHQRSIRVLVDALLNRTTPAADDVQYFNDIKASIGVLQARRRALADAQSQAELDAVPDD